MTFDCSTWLLASVMTLTCVSAPAAQSVPIKQGPLHGFVSCGKAEAGCELVVDRGALSEKRYRLVSHASKTPYSGEAYEKNFVKVLGYAEGSLLHVYGITLAVPDHHLTTRESTEVSP